MDGNKDEALKCLKIGKQALETGDRTRALKFLSKAGRLDPTLPIEDLISNANEQSSPDSPPPPSDPAHDESPVSNKAPGATSARVRVSANGPPSPSSCSSSNSYTEEQISIVRQIKKQKDYYAILGLEKGSSVDEVRKAYRKLSLKVHPDKNKAPGAEEAFKAVSKAFQCLSDDESRKRYDLVGSESSSSSSSSSSLYVYIDCNDAGVEFIHAAADVAVSEILDPIDVPQIVESFFALNGAVNFDGHSIPLLAVQVTELVDGIFIGCSINHSVVDGASFWHFFNAWSEIARRGEEGSNCISNPPITQRWFGDIDPSLACLPFSKADEFIERFIAPVLRKRIFHFTPESIARLKAKANEQCNSNEISSFQSLSALVWRSVIRARKLPPDQTTNCRLLIQNRSRLHPPLSPHYFGNCIQVVVASTTASQLLSHDLGWAAWLLHQAVTAHTDAAVRGTLEARVRAPYIFYLSKTNPWNLSIGSSPRFNVYGNDFGWGRPVAVRSGHANQTDGNVTSYPGCEGGGSVDLEICLLPECMNALELDNEFMDAVSHSVSL